MCTATLTTDGNKCIPTNNVWRWKGWKITSGSDRKKLMLLDRIFWRHLLIFQKEVVRINWQLMLSYSRSSRLTLGKFRDNTDDDIVKVVKLTE